MMAMTDKINKSDIIRNPRSIKEVMKLLNSLAARLNTFAQLYEVEIAVFDEAFDQSMQALTKAIGIAPDFENQGITGILETQPALTDFKKALSGSRESVIQMRDGFSDWPRISKNLNGARRVASRAMNKLVRSFDSAMNRVDANLELIEELKNKYRK